MTGGEVAAARVHGNDERERLVRALAKLTEQLMAARLTLRHAEGHLAAGRQVAGDEQAAAGVGRQVTGQGQRARAWSPPPRRSRRSRLGVRALVELCHPDLAGSEDERSRRRACMRRAELAHADDDADLLEALTREWLADGDAQMRPHPDGSTLLAAIHATLDARDEARVATYRLLRAGPRDRA